MTRKIKVRAHQRSVPSLLDNEKHRRLIAEIGFVPRRQRKPRVRIPALSSRREG